MPRSPAAPVTSGDGSSSTRTRTRTSKAAANRQHVIIALDVLRQAASEIARLQDRFNSCGPGGTMKEDEGRNRQADGSCDNVSKV